MKSIVNLSVFLLMGGLLFTACGGNATSKGEEAENTLSGTIEIDGSSTVYPITEAIAEEFRAVAPDIRVTIGVSGTGGGFKKFARGETVISNASRPIKESEAQACQQNGIEFIELEVAYDGLAVAVNPANDWCEYLTVEELKKIWEPAAQDVIKNWNQVRQGFPNAPLNLYGAGTASGTFDYFTEAIVGESGKSRGDYMPSEDDHVLVQGVAGDKNALGFFGLAYFEENADKLKLVAIDGGEGPVLPSLETVMNGTYKPLSRPLFIYVNSEGAKRPEVVKFVEFYLNNASKIASDVGYVPAPKEEYDAQIKKFKEFVAKYQNE